MKTTQNTVTFEMNGKAYRTDAATLDMLRGLVKDAKAANDTSAVEWAMALGQMGGAIVCMGVA